MRLQLLRWDGRAAGQQDVAAGMSGQTTRKLLFCSAVKSRRSYWAGRKSSRDSWAVDSQVWLLCRAVMAAECSWDRSAGCSEGGRQEVKDSKGVVLQGRRAAGGREVGSWR